MLSNNFRLYIISIFLYVFSGTTALAQSVMPETDTISVQMEPGLFFPVKKRLSSSSVYSVSGELLYKTPTANLTNTLYGLVPGLMVSQNTGEPGYDGASLNIRGIGSFNYGAYAVYVDGFQTQDSYWQFLSPAEIESISVLKDAAALAPFGMRGANGVIWIETKRGSAGKPKIKAHVNSGVQQAMHITKPLQSYDFASLYNEAVSNDNGRVWSPVYSSNQLESYKNSSGINTDWYANTLKPSGLYFSSDLTFDGGTQNAGYFIMLGATDTKGLYDVETDDSHANLQFRQYRIRSNLDFKMFNIFEGKIELGGRIDERKQPAYPTSDLWRNLEKYPRNIYPVNNENGTWTGTTIYPDNPTASIRELGYWSTKDHTIQANFYLKEKLDFLLPGLYLSQAASFNNQSRGTYNVTRNYERWIGDVKQTTDLNTNYSIMDDTGTNQWDWKHFKASAGYDRLLGKHSVSAVFNYLHNSYLVDVNQNGPAGAQMWYNYQDVGGRIHYEYNGKYTGEIGFAYSGSDNFAKGNRFGFYPAVSAAWILSNESFLENSTIIDLLKLRASVGKTAYDPFNWAWSRRFVFHEYYLSFGNFLTGNGATPASNSGIGLQHLPSKDIFAEECMKYNVGIEAKLFQGLTLTADAFMNRFSGIITYDNSLSALIGIQPHMQNIGKVTTKGIEADLNYSGAIGKFSYSVGGNINYLTDKIDYMAELAPASPLAAKTGNPIDTQIGYEFIGFYDVTDFNPDGTLKAGIPVPVWGNVQPGDMKYKDINGDALINEADMLKIGKRDFPELYYAFHTTLAFAGLDFRALFQGVAGRDVSLLKASNKTIAFLNNGNVYEIARGRWAYYPEQGIDTRDMATYPRLSTQLSEHNYRNSSMWIKNGNFLRFRNVEIGFTLPKRLSNLRIFVSGVNLFTFSSLLKDYGMDPETMTGYPAMKSYNAGITINF